MELYGVTQQIPHRNAGTLVAIGKWDGVHLAHQTIVRELVAEAQRSGGQSVVMGFHPLPMAVIRPSEAPPMLQTLEERAETLSGLGVDVHLAIPFDPAFAALSPEEFVRTVLLEGLNVRQVMVGFNFTFGKGGAGTAENLKQICARYGIPVRIFPPVRSGGENVSSTEVRFHVARGDMERAGRLLGRPFAMSGTVVKGDQRGRLLGYPTANLALAPDRQLPASGVYVARVTVLEQPRACVQQLPCTVSPRSGPVFGGMLNLGLRPTFKGADLRCEVNLFDFEGDLYGRELKVEFLQRLRGEQPFASMEALKAQLAIDEAAARAYLSAL